MKLRSTNYKLITNYERERVGNNRVDHANFFCESSARFLGLPIRGPVLSARGFERWPRRRIPLTQEKIRFSAACEAYLQDRLKVRAEGHLVRPLNAHSSFAQCPDPSLTRDPAPGRWPPAQDSRFQHPSKPKAPHLLTSKSQLRQRYSCFLIRTCNFKLRVTNDELRIFKVSMF